MPIHNRSANESAKLDTDETVLMDRTIVMLRMALLTEASPEEIQQYDGADTIFKRAIEMQIENVRSLKVLISNGLARSCFTILRTMLEVSGRFAWLTGDYIARISAYETGNQLPSIKDQFNAIGWGAAYTRLYGPLCKFSHGNFATSEIHRERGEVEQAKIDRLLEIEVKTHKESEGPELVAVYEKAVEEVLREFGPQISMHAFDFSLAMMIRGCGKYADSHAWWPKDFINIFDEGAANLHRESYVLWYLQREILAVQKVEKKFKTIPPAPAA